MKWILCLLVFAISCNPTTKDQIESQQSEADSWESLKTEAGQLGKESWRPMLGFVANLHQKSTHPCGDEYQHDTANKTINRIEAPEVFPAMCHMTMNYKVQCKKKYAAPVENI